MVSSKPVSDPPNRFRKKGKNHLSPAKNFFWKIFGASLGPDFWKFRLGQLVSVLGSQCSAIALAWWILEKTGSAKAMASVLAPAMAVNLFFLPLFGTLGDNFSRKKMIVIADLARFATSCGMAAMVYFNFFNLGLLAGLYIAANIGTALFDSASGGIIPQIVKKNKIQTALQQSEAIMSFGGIAGGVAGGLIVSFLGILGAFLIDAASFLLAAISSGQIQANTVPQRKKVPLPAIRSPIGKKNFSTVSGLFSRSRFCFGFACR